MKMTTNTTSQSSASSGHGTTITSQNVDNSLYSPSSSTSLLYHIYDQINIPNEHQQHQQQAFSAQFSQFNQVASSKSAAANSKLNHTNNNNNNTTTNSNNNNNASAATTTILNAADLLGAGASNHSDLIQPQIATSTTVQQLHQQQHEFQKMLQQQQQQQQQHAQPLYATNSYHIQQQQQQQLPYNTMHHFNGLMSNNNNAASYPNHNQNASERLMIDSMLLGTTNRLHHNQQQQQQQPQHYHANTFARHHHNQQQQQQQQQHDAALRHPFSGASYHARPLSSSGASSMSGHSLAVTYGRQARPTSQHLTASNGLGKSQVNLASVLQNASNTLDYLTLNTTSNATSNHNLNNNTTSTLAADNSSPTPKKFGAHTFALRHHHNNNNHHHHHHHRHNHHGNLFVGSGGAWIQAIRIRARKLANDYATMLKFFILFILLAFSLMSIVKFTLMNQQATSNNQQQPYPFLLPSHKASGNEPQAGKASAGAIELGDGSQNVQSQFEIPSDNISGYQSPTTTTGAGQAPTPDMLKSKLLICEFEILSQNYSQSQAQRLLLAENFVKLMDQVFLATDMRRYYLRMEVTNIRPNRLRQGIVVDCNIILSESIAYAAQQFGYALNYSLKMSNNKLANQASFIIDRDTIKFNTVPDKDLRMGVVPPGLLSTSVQSELLAPPAANPQYPDTAPSGSMDETPEQMGNMNSNNDKNNNNNNNMDLVLNSVVWSEWSQWSSCVDKNGVCDSSRLHSRLRKCVAQHTGNEVEANKCKQRFNMQDQELEVAECNLVCAQPQQFATGVLADAPVYGGPHTAPSVISNEPPTFMMPPPPPLMAKKPSLINSRQQQQQAPSSEASTAVSGGFHDLVQDLPSSTSTTIATTTSATSTENNSMGQNGDQTNGAQVTQTTLINLDQQTQQMSCSNCTGDEICLLLVSQKVPFCAKIKDRQDDSGCGGWCKAQSQLCQPMGQNAFKCIHDSECLASEWRCHNSACIPLSKRCDGHSNCYDSSDEHDCPSNV